MKIFLSGNYYGVGSAFCVIPAMAERNGLLLDDGTTDIPVLDSFAYIDEKSIEMASKCREKILDSGAFTFLNKSKDVAGINWEKYVDEYAEVVKAVNCPYFEVDVDPLIGLDNVLKLRGRLERRTGKQPIPVWHNTRSIEQFKRDCIEYPYVALGGLVTGTRYTNEQFNKLIQFAHRHKTKIHGLGITGGTVISKCHFDTVDSSSWYAGVRYGQAVYFDGKRLKQIKKPVGTRANSKNVLDHNFVEWVKMQRYAEVHL